MTEKSYFWGGIVTGDATLAPYDDDEFSDFHAFILTRDRTRQGVIATNHSSYSGNLGVTNPAGTTIRVATGIALVDGKLYMTDAVTDYSVTAPGAGTNYYTVVLRKSWVGQTVRLAMLGPSGGGYPAVTQTDGVTWEIALAYVSITSASVITITDMRTFLFSPTTTSTFVPTTIGKNITDGTLIASYNVLSGTRPGGVALPDNKLCIVSTQWQIPWNTIVGCTLTMYVLCRPENAGGNMYSALRARGGPIVDSTGAGSLSQIDIGSSTFGAVAFTGSSAYFRMMASTYVITSSDLGCHLEINFSRDGTNVLDTLGPGNDLLVYGIYFTYQAAS